MKPQRGPRGPAALTVFLLFAALLGVTRADASLTKPADVADLSRSAFQLPAVASSEPSRFSFAEDLALLNVEKELPRFSLIDGVETRRFERTYARNNPLKFVDPNGLSSLEFNRAAKSLTLFSSAGKVIGVFPASNNAQSTSKGLWPAGTYPMLDTHSPHTHGDAVDTSGVKLDSPKGKFGTHGIFRAKSFVEVKQDGTTVERTSLGVHAGREGETDLAGRTDFEYATDGCTRTTEIGMETITTVAATDPLQTITVVNTPAPPPTPPPPDLPADPPPERE